MWVFTRYGFYSAVCARRGDGSAGNAVDPGRVMVRARERGHLEALRARFPVTLRGARIRASAGTDYAFRFLVGKDAWSCVMAELAAELDYDNFKSEVARSGGGGPGYEHSLHQVWGVMRRLQDAGPGLPVGSDWP